MTAILTRGAPSVVGDPGESFDYLGLLARVKEALNSAQDIAVPVLEVRPFLGQPRTYFNPESLKRLSESIDAGGQTTPAIIRENPGETRYELVDGERRWRAVQMIPESRRPLYRARLIVTSDDVVQYLISGVANFNRENHTPLEVSNTINRLLRSNLPLKEIASLLGISDFWARELRSLKDLSPDVQAMLDPKLPKTEILPVSAAIQIAKMPPALQFGVATRVVNKDVSLPRLRAEVVSVAAKAGSPVRTHTQRRDKRWVSFGNTIGVIARTASDLEAAAADSELGLMLATHPKTGEEFLQKLREAKESIAHSEDLIRRATR